MADAAVTITHEAPPPAPSIVSESAALISMIERAARDPAVDIDKMQRLFEMSERAQATRARSEYLAAFSGLQAALPAVERKGTGHNDKKYARFEDLIDTIRTPLSHYGFSLSFRVEQPDGKVKVTGVLGHSGGHSEQTSLVLPADTSGNKNAVQAFGSSVSYGKRYVALTLLGIATEDEDDDGKKSAAGPTITEEQAGTLIEMIESVDGNTKKFCAYFNVGKVADLPAGQFERALAAVKARIGK